MSEPLFVGKVALHDLFDAFLGIFEYLTERTRIDHILGQRAQGLPDAVGKSIRRIGAVFESIHQSIGKRTAQIAENILQIIPDRSQCLFVGFPVVHHFAEHLLILPCQVLESFCALFDELPERVHIDFAIRE